MPHVIVKMAKGRSETEKQNLASRIALSVMNSLGASEDSISVAIEDVEPENWTEQVYIPEIEERTEFIYKKPGYRRF